MASKEKAENPALDEHGLVVQEYVSTVLVVVPPKRFDETALRYARSSLYNVHIRTYAVSTIDEELVEGRLQDRFQPDGRIGDARMEDYSGVIFCGGPGALELSELPEVQRLAREAAAQEKMICAWGRSTAVLAAASIVRGKKVTGDPSLRQVLARAGARYTGTQVEVDGRMVTAIDEAAGFRMGKALVQVVGIR